ncbi:AT-rich interactive domain-containing protein 3 [Salvia hispanica]|uniref:AT-rich interactive domain-containing protein 3 n=1 Tax=Salvia hispanica TaxID=49212 RepID=UPI002008EF58|nr:AT-rich interactive domain-containing protein 3 [Salvia hispanica]
MSQSDVEMVDSEKIHDDSGNNVQESKCEVVDPKEGEEEVPCEAAASGDVNGKEDVGEDINRVIDKKVEDKMDVETAVEDQTNLVKEVSEQIEGSDYGITITRSDNKELINTATAAETKTVASDCKETTTTETAAEAQTASSDCKEPINTEIVAEAQTTSAAEKQDDIKFEVVECDAANAGVKEYEPAKNDEMDGNQGEDIDKRSNEDADVKFEVVECDGTDSWVKEDEPSKNDMLDGNQGGDVEKKPTEDVAKEPGEIGKDTDDTKHVASETMVENFDAGNVSPQNRQLPTETFANKDPQGHNAEAGAVRPCEDEEVEDAVHCDQDKMVKEKEQGAESFLVSHETHGNEKAFETAAKPDAAESSLASQPEPFTPNSLIKCSSQKTADHSEDTAHTVSSQATLPFMGEDDDGTPEDQAAFMKELENFYRERAVEFKPPKFYGHPLNCLKLWRAVIRLGGYDRVTGSKLWRQVGESFHPPKTCTTVSWTFRIFYEKSLLEYERHKTQSGELQLPVVMLPEVSGADGEGNGYQGSGSGPGRARRDSAARAMQGWHAQRLGAGEVGDPIIKDKNLSNMAKNEKNLKSISSLKQKRPNEVEHSTSNKAVRTEISKQLVTSVVDVGPPADWVKINVRQTKECFEVYALVPGLLREEVRVQSDPAGRLVITGQPEQVDNPWGITPFKKVITLPARIQPVQTSAVVSLHGRLYVRIPIEQPSI